MTHAVCGDRFPCDLSSTSIITVHMFHVKCYSAVSLWETEAGQGIGRTDAETLSEGSPRQIVHCCGFSASPLVATDAPHHEKVTHFEEHDAPCFAHCRKMCAIRFCLANATPGCFDIGTPQSARSAAPPAVKASLSQASCSSSTCSAPRAAKSTAALTPAEVEDAGRERLCKIVAK